MNFIELGNIEGKQRANLENASDSVKFRKILITKSVQTFIDSAAPRADSSVSRPADEPTVARPISGNGGPPAAVDCPSADYLIER